MDETMDIEVKIVNNDNTGFDTIELNLDLNQTIGDIKNNLIKNNNINQDDNNNHNQQQQLLYHINSGLIFGDNVSINECLQQINSTNNDNKKLSLYLAKMFISNINNIESENVENNNNNNNNNNNININNNNTYDSSQENKTNLDPESIIKQEPINNRNECNEIISNDNNSNDDEQKVNETLQCEQEQQEQIQKITEYETIINNLHSEIEQYRSQIINLEKIIITSQQKESEEEYDNIHNIPPPPQLTSTEEAQRLRMENEAHVNQRRQSRVMIVKSKISSEIQRGPRKMIEYKEDSPFFWSQVKESENRIRRLSLRLNQLCDMILDLCSVTITFSEHCGRIHNLVKKSWEDVENQYSSDILSLNAQFNELGEQFAHMSNASKQLAVTMKAVLVDAFRDFSHEHLAQVSASSKTLQILEKEYEGALRKLLHTQKNLPLINPKRAKKENKKNASSSSLPGGGAKKSFLNLSSHYERITDMQQYAEWQKKVNTLRKDYELKRYDHCNTLNAVINRHRYELILNLCACFSGFETFFHVGYEASLAHKVFHRSIQMGVAEKTSQEDKNDKKLAKHRKEIQEILNDGKDWYKEKKREKLEKRKAKRKAAEKAEKKEKDNDDDDESDESDKDDDPYNVDYYSGYLWKQSSNMKKDWKRRWFVLENGELAYYRSRDKLDREFVVNTMLCKVKERLDHDYRFVFELISPSRRVYVLQAQSEDDFIAWCSVLRNQVHRLLRKNTMMTAIYDDDRGDNNKRLDVGSDNIQRSKSVMEIRQQKRELKRMIQDTNKQCADCNKRDPEWLSINTGVIICIGCCGIHRGLGTHISKVRSLILDDIPSSTLKSIAELGNNKINKILEHTIPSDYEKININSNSNEKEKYIKGKYMFKMFINPDINKQLNHEQINEKLYESTINNQLLGIFEALCYGANIDYQFEKYSNRTALHEASLANFVECTEFLLQNGASQNIEDDDGKTSRELAEHNECNQVIEILDYHIGFDTIQYNKNKKEREREKEKEKQQQQQQNNMNDISSASTSNNIDSPPLNINVTGSPSNIPSVSLSPKD